MDRRTKISIALKKAKTSLEKIVTTVDSGNDDCFPIIQQNLSVIGLLKSVNLLILESHLEHIAGKLSGKQAKELRTLHEQIIKVFSTAQSK